MTITKEKTNFGACAEEVSFPPRQFHPYQGVMLLQCEISGRYRTSYFQLWFKKIAFRVIFIGAFVISVVIEKVSRLQEKSQNVVSRLKAATLFYNLRR